MHTQMRIFLSIIYKSYATQLLEDRTSSSLQLHSDSLGSYSIMQEMEITFQYFRLAFPNYTLDEIMLSLREHC